MKLTNEKTPYDLSNDPSEKHNIADKHPEIVKELSQIMIDARTPSEIFKFNSSTYLNIK